MKTHNLPPLFPITKGYKRTYRLLFDDLGISEMIVVDELGFHINDSTPMSARAHSIILNWIGSVIESVREELGV